jgi:hypothetical protein
VLLGLVIHFEDAIPYFHFGKAFETSKVPPNPDIWVSFDKYLKNIKV